MDFTCILIFLLENSQKNMIYYILLLLLGHKINLCSIISIKYKRSKMKIHFFPRVEIPSPTPRIINAGAK